VGWLVVPARPRTVPAVVAFTLVAAGLALWTACWFWSRPTARASGAEAGGPVGDVGRLLRRAAVCAAPLLAAPPLGSRDAWSYAAVGNMVRVGVNPYLHGPAAVPGAFANAVDPMWSHTPSPYGPLFVQLAGLVVTGTGPSLLLAVLVMRVVAVVGLVLVAVYLPRLARACGGSPPVAVWLVLLNPVVLLHLVAGQHNEALMIGLMVAALALALEGSLWHGAVLAALAASIKVPAVVVVVAIGLLWGSPVPERLRRIRGVVLAGGLCLLMFAVLGAATGLGWGWVPALRTPGEVRSWLSVPTAAGVAVGWVLDLVGAGDHTDELIRVSRLVGATVAAVVGASLLLWASPRRMVQAAGITLLALAVLAPADQPWYPLWGGVLLAATRLSRRGRRLLVAGSLVLCGNSLSDLARVPLGLAGQLAVVAVLVVVAVVGWKLLARPASRGTGWGVAPRRGEIVLAARPPHPRGLPGAEVPPYGV
jgi:hypothetical protein